MVTQMQKIVANQSEDRIVVQQAFSTLRVHTDMQFKKIANNIARSNPLNLRRLARGNDYTRSGLRKRAVLSNQIQNLHHLWDEWLVWLEGNLPAKEFSSIERGKVKHKYSKRMHVWRCISKHVNAGFSAEQAIDRIYTVFGHNLSVTKIIKSFQNAIRDHGARGHPNLVV